MVSDLVSAAVPQRRGSSGWLFAAIGLALSLLLLDYAYRLSLVRRANTLATIEQQPDALDLLLEDWPRERQREEDRSPENEAKSIQFRNLALDLCREVINDHPDSEAANFARDLLLKFGL